jgi:hypothetical protein
MSGSLIISPTAAYVDATGIHAPTFSDIQAFLISQYQAIYGADIEVDPATQDGQLIGLFALAISDVNAACVAVYNSFSPSTAQGIGLSSMVKINGMARQLPSNSTAPMRVVGVAGTVITNGIVKDTPGNDWALPPSVTIPGGPTGGEIIVTATCQTPGAIGASTGDIARISNPQLNWQSAVNTLPATPGAPVENDALLRLRQSSSTALPSNSILEGITGAIFGLPGVTACKGYENDTSTDYTVTAPPVGEAALPPHSIAMVVVGGDATQICETILLKKTPGCFTYGNIRESVQDIYGLAHDIGYFYPAPVQIGVRVSLHAKPGYSTAIATAIQTAVANYINDLGSGVDVVYSKLFLPANLCDATGVPSGSTNTYDIFAMTVGTPPDNLGFVGYASANVPISLLQVATCDPADVIIFVG